MKRIAIVLLATAAALAASSARADTRVSVGIHVGGPSYHPAPPVVVHAPAPVYYSPPSVVHYVPARGYWKEVVVKAWMPERWDMGRDRWGRPVRVFEPGHFAYRTERVWVDGRRDHRGHAYGWSR